VFESGATDTLLINARIAQGARRPDEARALLNQALALDPDHPMTLTLLGELLLGQRDYAAAVQWFDRALASETHFAPAWFHRARALWFSGRQVESLESARRAQAIQPANMEYRIQRAQLSAWLGFRRDAHEMLRPLQNDTGLDDGQRAHLASVEGEVAIAEGRSEDANRHLKRALALNPDMPVPRMMLGMNQLRRGEFAEGWVNYASRETIRHYYPHGPPRLPGQLWTGQSLVGRSIVVIDDQGHGDSIQFFRFLLQLLARERDDIAVAQTSRSSSLLNRVIQTSGDSASSHRALGAKQVILLTFPGLDRLFRQAAPQVTVLTNLPAVTQTDYHCNSTALLRWLGVSLETIPDWAPYLFAPVSAGIRLPARRRSGRTPQVGLAWSGDPTHTRDHLRSIPADLFLELADLPGIGFHSLQRVVRPADQPALQRRRRIGRAVEDAADFADTAALIDRLDLIVTVDTGVAHLAAAMGKPVWLVLHRIADWRWLMDRDDSPWYPTMRLFRGRTAEWGDGDMGWRPLLDRVAAALRAQFGV
jgi:tetratricopeptide (TPR) repeat protein